MTALNNETNYPDEKSARARLVSAEKEFPPNTVVTVRDCDHRFLLKNWYRANNGYAGMGVYVASVLGTSLDAGLSGDVWLNVNHLKKTNPNP